VQPVQEETKKEIADKDVEMGFDISRTKHKGQVFTQFGSYDANFDLKTDPDLLFCFYSMHSAKYTTRVHESFVYYIHLPHVVPAEP
jgi:hypothetical protein